MKMGDAIGQIKNIGEKRQALFHRLNVYTVGDLLAFYPRDYEDRSQIKKIDELIIGEENAFIGKIKKAAEVLTYGNKTVCRLKMADETGTFEVLWHGQPYMKNVLLPGKTLLFFGKVRMYMGKIQMENPEHELVIPESGVPVAGIMPIYRATYGLSQKQIRSVMLSVLKETNEDLPEPLPLALREKYHLMDKNDAVRNIHFPKNNDAFFEARRRLVFEELFLLQCGLFRLKKNRNTQGLRFDPVDLSDVYGLLPYELTDAQKKVVAELTSDFLSGYSMNRLVQGDVGSGKTAIALVSAVMAIRNGFQVCLMAPTEVLAMQHFLYFHPFFDTLGIQTVFLSGTQKQKEKRLALAQIESGEGQMIIGTHAVIQEGVIFYQLGYVITDEQHRFGVRQREQLTQKGVTPHVLVMSATPIPRTLALILYGDLDISIIDQLPPGRQKIDTFFVSESYQQRIYAFMQKEIDQGRQCYVICPMIEESENAEMKAVVSYATHLAEVLSPTTVACLHGKLKPDEKNKLMGAFARNEIAVIVATTVIEVGVNVPNATMMVIQNAERFGLSQLHQLRGRVGRGAEKSYCIMISNTKNKQTKQRLEAMVRSNDGFHISELDLQLRGSGDFFGTRQHGLPEFKIANLYRDMDVLKTVQEAVVALPLLPQTPAEQQALDKQMEKWIGNVLL